MINDTQVVFRGIDHSQAVEEAVQKRAEKLARFSDQIQSLRVTVESPHNNHHKGKVYHVGVEAFIPNHDIVVNHDQHDNHAHEDIYVAIRDTFDAVERQIKDINAKERRQTRTSNKLSELAAVPEVEDISDIDDIADIVSVDEYQESEAANQ
ncbi:MAG: ribosome-associated translation inhibitor RaiA [Gammaproteobacteria bacterium]|jgi:ribosomal subunit interface protein|nr:ribosome-associated translation inhibitor RaiA [Gammaproteobacteria bacterium]MBT6043291.1 ribosome-associated translation inhibitor RaiA [Gammaproteobacteria bacterium]